MGLGKGERRKRGESRKEMEGREKGCGPQKVEFCTRPLLIKELLYTRRMDEAQKKHHCMGFKGAWPTGLLGSVGAKRKKIEERFLPTENRNGNQFTRNGRIAFQKDPTFRPTMSSFPLRTREDKPKVTTAQAARAK